MDNNRCIASFSFLECAAEFCDEREKEADELRIHVKETFTTLKKIWPKGDGKPPLPSLSAATLANLYYVMALPTSRPGEKKHTHLLLLAESHATTPSSLVGKPWSIGSNILAEDRPRFERLMKMNHHYGHINLVNCVSYGESWLLRNDDLLELSDGERRSVRMGTDQFWRVLSTLAGDCDVNEGVSAVDVLAEGRQIKDAFGHVVVGGKRVVGSKSDGNMVFSRLENKIRILKTLKDRRIVVADVCPFAIYNGVGNAVKRTNQKTGNEYIDRVKTLSGKEHAAIIRTAWEGYAQHLIKYYNPMKLVVLGVGVEKAVTSRRLEAIMREIGGDYLGSLRHPSWNGYYGNKSIVLFRELRKLGVDCTGHCNLCTSVNEMGDFDMCDYLTENPHMATSEKDGLGLDDSEEAPPLNAIVFGDGEEEVHLCDGSSYDSEGAFATIRKSDRSVAGLLTDEIVQLSVAELLTLPMEEQVRKCDGSPYESPEGAFATFRESDWSVAGLLTDEIVQLSVAELLTLPMEEQSSDTIISANISSLLVDDANVFFK